MALTPNDSRSNMFVVENNLPYLMGDEFIHSQDFHLTLPQFDPSMISKTPVKITNANKQTTVELTINRTSDTFVSNHTKYKNLVNIVSSNVSTLKGILPVLKKTLVVQIDYQIENSRTKDIIRQASLKAAITDWNYYVQNPTISIDNGKVVTGFKDNIFNTVSDYIAGTDQMIYRITKVSLFYMKINPDGCGINDIFIQNKIPSSLIKPDASNQLYKFDNNYVDIILNNSLINSSSNKVIFIPIGNPIVVDQTFAVSVAHKVLYKLSIWQDDIILVADTRQIAQALGITSSTSNPVYEDVMEKINEEKRRNDVQDFEISVLKTQIENMQTSINTINSSIVKMQSDMANFITVDQVNTIVDDKINNLKTSFDILEVDVNTSIASMQSKIDTLNSRVVSIENGSGISGIPVDVQEELDSIRGNISDRFVLLNQQLNDINTKLDNKMDKPTI